MRESLKSLGRLTVVVSLSLAMTACGKALAEEAGSYALSCGASDQHGGYMNPIDARNAVTLTVDSSFEADELSRIQGAIDTWNEFDSRNGNSGVLFKTVSVNLQSATLPKTSADCNFPGAGSELTIVKVTDAQKWKELGLQTNNPGVTIRCSAGANYVARQVILINPNYVELGRIESVILHELGHGLGLDHSCSANGDKPGLVACSDTNLNSEYEKAVMYPWLGSPKESLRANDEERASCILGASRAGV